MNVANSKTASDTNWISFLDGGDLMAVKYGSIWVKLPIDVEHWSRVVYSLVMRAEVKTSRALIGEHHRITKKRYGDR